MLTHRELKERLDKYAELMEENQSGDFDFASRFFHATCAGQGVDELEELIKRGVDIDKYYVHLSNCGIL